MSQFEEDLSIRLESIKDSNFKIKIKNSFRGNEKYKNHINELKQKDEFKDFFNNWKYESKIIYNITLWKKHKYDFFNLENSYFFLNTEEDFHLFKTFLENECKKNIKNQTPEFIESKVINIYEEFLMNYNPIGEKEKILKALKEVLEKKLEASYDKIIFLAKIVNININKPKWYEILDLSKDQVSVISQKSKLCKTMPDCKEIIEKLAINKFKLIAHSHISENIKRKIFNEIEKNPSMTQDEIKNRINSYKIFNENDIDSILKELKLIWPNLNSKDKIFMSFHLYKIKEKIINE